MQTTGIKLINVLHDSPAAQAGLRSGDRLLSLNGRVLEDVLDLHFYLDGGEASFQVQRGDLRFDVSLDLADDADPGWEVEPLEVRSCHCDCKFCFVQQLPTGLRPSLYVKDEDYRFSFLFGSYLTLVGFTSRDLERVLRLRLSPLYVSIHATDPLLRGRLLGLKRAPILPMLEKLIAGGIQIHGQIVLVPGYNDEAVLQRTLEDLKPLYPGLASLSVVPVGLTGHRMNLEALRLLNRDDARRALDLIKPLQDEMLASTGSRWVFPADELLLLAGQAFPADDEYEDYPQLDNGVGLVRWTLSQVEVALEALPNSLPESRRQLWVTGHSAYPVLQSMAKMIMEHVAGLSLDVIAVDNHLLGESVTVAGLLGGKDIAETVKARLVKDTARRISPYAAVYLPPSCINSDGLLLDDWTEERISAEIGLPVLAFDGCWETMILGAREEVQP